MAGDRLGMSPGDGAPAPTVGAKLGGVAPAEIGAFYEKELPGLVLFVTVSADLDVHAAADVAQTAFERALPRWAHTPRRRLFGQATPRPAATLRSPPAAPEY
jgi:hypothetical protein